MRDELVKEAVTRDDVRGAVLKQIAALQEAVISITGQLDVLETLVQLEGQPVLSSQSPVGGTPAPAAPAPIRAPAGVLAGSVPTEPHPAGDLT